jgi:hypothetical protein
MATALVIDEAQGLSDELLQQFAARQSRNRHHEAAGRRWLARMSCRSACPASCRAC